MNAIAEETKPSHVTHGAQMSEESRGAVRGGGGDDMAAKQRGNMAAFPDAVLEGAHLKAAAE